jgi:hypothetical protein
MANKNIPLVIAKPNRGPAVPVKLAGFVAKDTGDFLRIPRRYPFAAITAPAGFFRHNVEQNTTGSPDFTAVSSELGGVAGANALTTLGYELPPTEKLVLLVRKGPAVETAATVVIKGSLEYRIDDVTITLPAADAAGTIYEIDLFAFGLLIGRKGGVVKEEDGIVIIPGDTSTGLLLVARTA